LEEVMVVIQTPPEKPAMAGSGQRME